jgi:hypothetical protein
MISISPPDVDPKCVYSPEAIEVKGDFSRLALFASLRDRGLIPGGIIGPAVRPCAWTIRTVGGRIERHFAFLVGALRGFRRARLRSGIGHHRGSSIHGV